jgi:alpha-galactosidase
MEERTDMKPKIVVIGAGSYSFGTMTIRDLMEAPELRGTEMALVDVNEERLDRMVRLVGRLNETWEAEFKITAATDRCDVLPGADIVVSAVEQRRYPMWQMDIDIPRKHTGIELYGENGGPGGLFHTLRQVPLTLDIASDVERLCPDAWFINMSNPESRLCLALERHTKVKNVGICLGAYITRRHLAQHVLGLTEGDVDVKAAGINHCHWVVDVRDNRTGEDLYPAVRERIEGGAVDPEWQPLSQECLRRFGLFPGPGDTHVGEYISWAHGFLPPTYTDWVFQADDRQDEMEARLEAVAGGEGPLDARELEDFMAEAGYRWQTLDVILSLLDNGNRYVLSVNIPNEGYVTNLHQGSVVEVPALVGADRIYGLGMGKLPPAIASLLNRQLTIMEMNVEAAVTGDRQLALEALIIDPLVPDPQAAERILDEMLVAQADLLPQFS